jgi:ribosomal protein S13
MKMHGSGLEKRPVSKLAFEELQTIPGIGKSIARDLVNIGITKVTDLKNKNPERIYEKINEFYAVKQDICLLYVMRCAVYYASTNNHQKAKLNWWYWKNKV